MKIPEEKFLTVKGHKICYFDEGKGQPILLLHGWFSCKETLLPLIDKLTHSFRVIAIDIPGFGLSEAISLSPDLHEIIEVIEAFVVSLGIKTISVFGFSFGGVLTLLYNLQYPKQVKCFILKSSFTSHDQLPWFFNFPPCRFFIMTLARTPFLQHILVYFLKHFFMHYQFQAKVFKRNNLKYQDELEKYMRDLYERRFYKIDFFKTCYITANYLLHFDLQNELGKNKTPGMLRLNENDPLIKYLPKYYNIPHTTLTIIRSSRIHSILDENLSTFSRKIKDFLFANK